MLRNESIDVVLHTNMLGELYVAMAFDLKSASKTLRLVNNHEMSMGQLDKVSLDSQGHSNSTTPANIDVFQVKPNNTDILPSTLKTKCQTNENPFWAKVHSFRFENAPDKPEKIRVAIDYQAENTTTKFRPTPLLPGYQADIDDETSDEDISIDDTAVELSPFNFFFNDMMGVVKIIDEDSTPEIPVHIAAAIGRAISHNRNSTVQQILDKHEAHPASRTPQAILGDPADDCLDKADINKLPGNTLTEKQECLKSLKHLGKAAAKHHQLMLGLATTLKLFPENKMSDEQLIKFAVERAEIQSRLKNSKITMFQLPRDAEPTPEKSRKERLLNL